MALRYKFIELSIVTDETLEVAVNEWVGIGWQLDGIRFVVTEHSKRPAMAFVVFTRQAAPDVAPGAGARQISEACEGTPHVIAADDNDVE